MNNEVSGSPSNSSDKNIEIMNTNNTNNEARTVVVEVDSRISVDMHDENNENEEARAVVEESENRIITHEKKKKKKKKKKKRKSITFDDQTAIVVKRKKDNEKKNTVACFVPKVNEFENYLEACYKSTDKKTWNLVTTEKVNINV